MVKTMENEKTAICFESMEFKAQESIINACLMNTAKMINSLQTINDKTMERNNMNTYSATTTYRDCVKFLNSNHDEIFNDCWIACIESYAINPLMPLALFVSKASGKALRKAFYWNAKSASEKIDTETLVNCCDCFDCYSDIFNADRVESIIEQIRDSLKEYARNTIEMVNCGYTFDEIAEYNGLSRDRQSRINSAIVNAIAIVNTMEKDWNALDRIIASTISYRDIVSRNTIESAIIAEYKKEFKAEHESIISWQVALERLKSKAYMNVSQASLASAFYSK